MKHIRMAQRRFATIVVLVFCVALISPTSIANAQTPASPDRASLTVSPPTAELDATPGKTLSHKIKLTNSTEARRTIEVQVQNFEASGEQGQAVTTEEDNEYQLRQWIKVNPQKVTLDANKDQTFDISIDVPAEAPPGGHFGAIVFSPEMVPGQVSTVAQITSLILLRVPGAATEKAEIAGINVCKPTAAKAADGKMVPGTTCDKSGGTITSGGDLVITTRVRNAGNIQVQPQGTVTIYNIFGSKKATIKVGPKNAIPSSVRRLDGTWKHGLLLGSYKMKVDLTYGSQGQELRGEKTVWAFPVKAGLITLGVLVLLFLVFWLPRKRLRKAFRALTSSD